MAEYSENFNFRLDDQDDDYNVDVFNGNFVLVDGALKGLQTKEFAGTLTVAGWVGSSAPFVQTVAVEGLPAEIKGGDIGLPIAATDAQDKAARDARLRPIDHDAGTVTVKATGKKPSIAIPFVIQIRG